MRILPQTSLAHGTRTVTSLASSSTNNRTAHDSVSSAVFLVLIAMSRLYTVTANHDKSACKPTYTSYENDGIVVKLIRQCKPPPRQAIQYTFKFNST